MLQPIIDHINTKLANLNQFNNLHGLTEQVRRIENNQTTMGPAEYIGNGNYQDIDFDPNGSLTYIRSTGRNPIIRQEGENAFSACGYEPQITIPLRVVAYYGKDILQSDDAYTDNKMAANIIFSITSGNLKDLRTATKANTIEINPTNIITDPFTVWNEEYSGVPFTLNSGKSLIAVDFEVVLDISSKCWEYWACEGCE